MLLGTAVGDALGLYMEGLPGKTIERWFKNDIDRYYLLGNIGFVSDDTEQSALVAQSIIRHSQDASKCTRSFQLSMAGWFCRMPFGVGRATCFSCLKMMTGVRATGIRSAGNGAAMRAAIIGAFFYDKKEKRIEFATKLSCATHIDERAIEGALLISEIAAAACASLNPTEDSARYECFDSAIEIVRETSLFAALMTARRLAEANATIHDASQQLGCSGFVNHSVPLSVFVFLRFGGDVLLAVQNAIRAGGDTDTNAAIVGALCGALKGERSLPQDLIAKINDGPFGPTHLRGLARALTACKQNEEPKVPTYFWPICFARNVALIPIILSHAMLRSVRR